MRWRTTKKKGNASDDKIKICLNIRRENLRVQVHNFTVTGQI